MPQKMSSEKIKKIEETIFALESKAVEGLLNPDAADACIREIRTGLFDLMKIIRKETAIVNDAPAPGGSDAA